MPSITLITTSPFPGQEQLREVTFRSLTAQTCTDFVWMYLDGCYSANKAIISEFAASAPFPVVHVPLMHDCRTPRHFHWEPYNSALLLCDTEYFLRWGRFRDYHPHAVEDSIRHMSHGFAVDFAQRQAVEEDIGKVGFAGDISWHDMPHPHSSCGMFGMKTAQAIEIMNGNDEVGLHQNHFEDVEMNGRMRNISGIACKRNENGLIRFRHNKDTATIKQMEKPAAGGCGSPGCPHTAPSFQGRREAIIAAGHSDRIEINGMDFWSCRRCGGFAPGDADEYRDWVNADNRTRSLIGVGGHGRDLPALRDKISKLGSLASRVAAIEESYG